MLRAPGMLAEHLLAEEQQHEQSRCERRLNHHQWRQQQRDDLEGPAQDRKPGAEQPAGAFEQSAHECHAQVLLGRGLPGVECLQNDP